MTELCLIRHGETEWNLKGLTQGSTDIPLNELGREQARLTGAHLTGERWDALYASDLSRARETAAIIGGEVGLPAPVTDARLRERGFGEAEGLGVDVRKSRYTDSSSIPGAEPWAQVSERGIEALEEIVRKHDGRRLIVVSHGGLIISVLGRLSDGVLGPGRPLLRNLSMTLITFNGSWEIPWYNRVAPELEDEAVSA